MESRKCVSCEFIKGYPSTCSLIPYMRLLYVQSCYWRRPYNNLFVVRVKTLKSSVHVLRLAQTANCGVLSWPDLRVNIFVKRQVLRSRFIVSDFLALYSHKDQDHLECQFWAKIA